MAHLGGGPSLDFDPFGRSGRGFGPILEGLTHMRGVRPGFGPILGGQTWILGVPDPDLGPFRGSGPGFGPILGTVPGFGPISEGRAWIWAHFGRSDLD